MRSKTPGNPNSGRWFFSTFFQKNHQNHSYLCTFYFIFILFFNDFDDFLVIFEFKVCQRATAFPYRKSQAELSFTNN